MLGQVELNADSRVYLKMVCASYRLRYARADRRSHARTLRERKACLGASDAALQLELHTLLIDRRINAIEIVECLAVLQRAVVASGRLEVDFCSNAKMFGEHEVAAKAQEETTKARRRLACRVSRREQAAAKCVGRGGSAIDALSGGFGMGASKTEIDVE